MANTATVIILTAGTATFANEWYQTNQVNWRVPVATVLVAAAFDVFARVDSKAATIASVIVLIGALTATLNGNSILDEIAGVAGVKPKKKKAVHVQ